MADGPVTRSILSTPQGTDPNDPWVTSNGVGYDVKKVYSRASDGRGHSEVISIKISPALDAVIREVIERVPEYNTKSDVVRDALVHRLHEIARWPADHPNLQPLQWELAQQGIDYAVQCQKDWEELIASAKKLINVLIDQGDYETAELQIGVMESLQDMTPPYLMKMGVVCQEARARMNGYRAPNTGRHD